MRKTNQRNWASRKNFTRPDTEDNRQLAFNFALRYLSLRSRSTKEVFDYLVRKHFTEASINPALQKLTEMKFLNDDNFAEMWVESRQKYKHRSKLILKQELRQKGINSTTIDKTLNEAQDDFEIAKAAYDKKKKTIGHLPPEEFRKKMGGFLSRRGYSWEIISKLIKD